MTQTTGAMNLVDAVVEIKIGSGGSWVDISGVTNSVDPGDGGPRMTGDFFTHSGDKAIVKMGKRQPVDIKTKIAFEQSAGAAYAAVQAAYENKTQPVYLRWSKDGLSGSKRFVSDEGYISVCPPPMTAADKADIAAIDFTIHSPGIEPETIP